MPNKVLQLDALSLDVELLKTLDSKLSAAFGDSKLPINIQKFGTKFASELELVLRLLLFKSTIWNKGNTYGLLLQNLIPHDSNAPFRQNISRVRKLLLLSSIVGTYLYSKFERQLYSTGFEANGPQYSKRSVIKILGGLVQKLNNAYIVLSLVNFIAFLFKGRYPTLSDRILGVSYIPISNTEVSLASNPEAISYEFQDRQLVWNTLTEFLAFTLPLISVRKLMINLKRIFNVHNYSQRTIQDTKDDLLRFLPQSCCAICYQKSEENSHGGDDISIQDNLITNPYITNCGHVYCYFCIINKLDDYNELNGGSYTLESAIDDGSHWNCLRCGKPVLFCKPYEGDCQNTLLQLADKEADVNESEDGEASDIDGSGDDYLHDEGDNFNEDTGNNEDQPANNDVDDEQRFEDDELEEMDEDTNF